MLRRIFPECFDNRFRGNRLALWLFYPITLLNVVISLVAIFSKDSGAQTADGIPLNTYDPAGAAAVIGVAAFLGMASLLLCALFVLALVRYRSMIPLLYVLLVVNFVCHKGIGWMKPIARDGTHAGSVFSLCLIVVTALGLVLSLGGRGIRGRS